MKFAHGAGRATRVGLSLAATLSITLPGHPAAADASTQNARLLGPAPAGESISLALTLPLQDQSGLADLIQGLHNPADARYGKYLTADQFTARFSPTSAQYLAAVRFAAAQGLVVTGTHPGRTVLDVKAPASVVERAFDVTLYDFRSPDGRVFHAAGTAPALPASGVISGVVGLDNAAFAQSAVASLPAPGWSGAGLGPADIKKAYGLDSTTLDGTGQTLALFELDGYNADDVAAYQAAYKLPSVPMQNVLVDGFDGLPHGSGVDAATADVELQTALAPKADKVLVYEAANGAAGMVDSYTQIADDDAAQEVSVSWSIPETQISAGMLAAEAAAFARMAAQGQTVFAAAGNQGAYAEGLLPVVNDPASQPLVTGVGGTSLALNADRSYLAETTFNLGSPLAGASGGGVSSLWAQPSYQAGLGFSATARNVPDVSLDADPNTGYAVFSQGHWQIVGGTSAASSLWAAYAALVNQQRFASGLQPLGFANPALYRIGQGSNGATDFHDIVTGSNLFYAATPGYDNATGWGSFNGAALLADLTAPATVRSLAAKPHLVVKPLLAGLVVKTTTLKGGTADSGTITLSGPAPTGGAAITMTSANSAIAVPAVVPATVTVPAGATSATFNFTPTAVATAATGALSATFAGVTVSSASVTVNPPALTTLAIAPTSLVDAGTVTGTVTLDSPAPTGGTAVTLASDNAAATVGATVTVAAGAKTATFTVTATAVTAATTAHVTATLSGTTKTATVTLSPLLVSLTVKTLTLKGGTADSGTITLAAPAHTGGAAITMTSANSAIAVPAVVPTTVTVPAGAKSVTFNFTPSATASAATGALSATYAGLTVHSASVTVNPPALTTLAVAPTSLIDAGTVTGTVTLDSPAPTGGTSVTLASDNAAATVPATVTVAAGAKTATFTVTATAVTSSTTVTVSATLGGVTKTAALTLKPLLVSLVVKTTTLKGGTADSATVTLAAPAPTGGTSVTLASANSAVTLPATVTVPARATSVTFAFTPAAVGTAATGALSATYAGLTVHSASVTVNPPALTTLAITPATLIDAGTVTGTVTLDAIAPTGGTAVTLSSNNAAATVPATVTVAAGAKTATFTVTATAVTSSTTVTVSATLSGTTKTAAVTLKPLLVSLTVKTLTLKGGTADSATVTLAAPAPTGGTSVTLASANSAVTLPATVTVPARATSVTFAFTPAAVGTAATGALSATYAGLTVHSASVTVNPPVPTSVTLPATMDGAGTGTGTVTLDAPAPTGGASVTLASSSPAATVPASVTVAAGSKTATFTVTATAVTSSTTVNVSATYAGTTVTSH